MLGTSYMEASDMRGKINGIIKCAVFIGLLLGVLCGINKLLVPKYYLNNSYWPTTSSYRQFYKMKKNTVDVLFFGSSVCVNAFSPEEIYESYGIRSYNLGSEQQSLFLSYYWLKEALRFQSPQVVVVDARFCVIQHEENPINTTEGLTRKCLDPMQFSPVKAEAVSALCKLDESQPALSYYLTNIRFHDRWKSLGRNDFIDGELTYSDMKGYAPGNDTPIEYVPFEPSDPEAEADNMHAVSMEYLQKMADLCRAAGIKLVLVNVPGNPINDGINNIYTRFARQNDVDYYNFCEASLYRSIGAQFPEEVVVGHANLKGGIKMSRRIGQLLQDEYNVQQITDAQYESGLEFYHHIVKNAELPYETDIERYIALIRDDRYAVLFAAKDEAQSGLTDAVKAGLQALGLRAAWDDNMFRSGYAAVIAPDGVTEQWGGQVSVHGSFDDKNQTYSIVSAGFNDGNIGTISIANNEYSKNQRGLNIVVYDLVTKKVIDSVCFDTYDDMSAQR